MYVIFPADELILMTYGAAIPRIRPRPSLDCLPEPKVPFPSRSDANTTTTAIPAPAELTKSGASRSASKRNPKSQFEQFEPQLNSKPLTSTPPVFANTFTYDNLLPTSTALPSVNELPTFTPTFTQSLPPTPTRRTSRVSLTRDAPSTTNRSSFHSQHSQRQTPPPRGFTNQIATPPIQHSYFEQNMRSAPQQQQQQSPSQRSPLERSTPIRATTPLRSTQDLNYYSNKGASGGGYNSATASAIDYPTGSLGYARDRSPSIYLEPPSPITDPTQPRFGAGWGRPMSPMDLPPAPSSSKSTPPSKSRLRPKLHIPLGRLGRAQSSDQRESYRLREDLQLHVENPIFNSENLRQRNFDAFFESGEPVYRLQPKSPASAPADADSASYTTPTALDNYAGVYDSSPRARSATTSAGGGLFVRSPSDEKTLKSRSKSDEQPFEQSRNARAASVGPRSAVPQKDFSAKSSSGPKSRRFFGWRGPRSGSLGPQANMASNNGVLKEYGHSSLNEAFKSQNNVNFKLIKTVSDFTESLSLLYEEHATALQTLVSNYRKKNAELRKERPACHLAIFQAWETFLQEVETDSQAATDVASVLSRQVSRPMLDKSFHRKVQSRKIFTHRESFETIIAKTEEKLSKCRLDYKQCYMSHRQNPTQLSLTEYIDAHNAYVQQLHATNAMLETYHFETVPQLMQELEEIHNDLCSIIADAISQGADVIANKASDQAKRYSNLTSQCNSVSPTQDLQNFVRILPLPSQAQKFIKRMFAPSHPAGEGDDGGDYNEIAPILRDELVFDRHSTISLRPALESLKREAIDLEMQIRQLQDSIDVLNRAQARGVEGQLYNKVNELQEDLSMKKFDLRAKQMHLAAIKAQVISVICRL